MPLRHPFLGSLQTRSESPLTFILYAGRAFLPRGIGLLELFGSRQIWIVLRVFVAHPDSGLPAFLAFESNLLDGHAPIDGLQHVVDRQRRGRNRRQRLHFDTRPPPRGDRRHDLDAVLPVARMKNVGVLAKRPIGNSCWRELSEFQAFYPEYVRPYRERLEKMGLTPQAVGFQGDWPELALRFTLSQPGVHTAIIGTTNPDNARANIELANKGPLPDDVVAKLRQAFARASDGKWPGLQ